MAMSARNFVGASNGGYDVYVNGSKVGWYPSLDDAQKAYNNAGGPAAEAQEAAQGTTAPPAAPGTASTAPAGNPGGGAPSGSVGSAEAAYALSVWTAAQTAKANADRLNLLDIPKWQKDAAIADADLKLRQAIEARNALNDEQKRQLDAQTGALNQAKVFGYGQTLGAGTGARITQAGAELRADPNYQAVSQRAATGDQAAIAQKRQMELGGIANATGLPMDRAGALYDQLGERFRATGAVPTSEEIDRLLAQDPSYSTPTLEREKYGTDTALEYQRILASKAGRPEDAFTYAGMIRDTPDSIRNLVNTAAARVGLPGLGVPPVPGGGGQRMALDQAGYNAAVAPLQAQEAALRAQGITSGPQLDALRQQDQALGQQYGVTRPATGVDPRPATPGFGAGEMGSGGPRPILRTADSLGQPVAAVDPRPAQPTAMPLASQIAPQDYQRANSYVQKLVWAGYGANNADPDAEKEKYLRSLPGQSGARAGTIRR